MITIRDARKIKQWNQTELAKAIGSYQRRISQLERGEVTPDLKEAQAIALALGRHLGEMFPQFGSFDMPDVKQDPPAPEEPKAIEDLKSSIDKLNLKIQSAMRCLDLLMLLVEKTCGVLESVKQSAAVKGA